MNIPFSFQAAIDARREVLLTCNQEGEPSLRDTTGTLLWPLEGFSYGAASLFVDNLLEGAGYMIVPDSGLRWRALDSLEELGKG